MKITIEIPAADAELIKKVLLHFNTEPVDELTTHGPLTMEKLAKMLLEDVALAWRRPGSWEGSNMINVLQSHGYNL